MLLLVDTNRHKVGVKQQNIRRHKHGIIHKSHIYVVGVLCAFVLKLRHTRRLADVGVAVEYPGKLGVLTHVGLKIYYRVFGTDSASQKLREKIDSGLSEFGRLAPHRKSVQVGNEKYGIEISLHPLPVLHRAEIIAERNRTRRLYSAKYNFFLRVLRIACSHICLFNFFVRI